MSDTALRLTGAASSGATRRGRDDSARNRGNQPGTINQRHGPRGKPPAPARTRRCAPGSGRGTKASEPSEPPPSRRSSREQWRCASMAPLSRWMASTCAARRPGRKHHRTTSARPAVYERSQERSTGVFICARRKPMIPRRSDAVSVFVASLHGSLAGGSTPRRNWDGTGGWSSARSPGSSVVVAWVCGTSDALASSRDCCT